MSAPLLTAGWRERVALPDWGIKSIKAKLDTGARTSAIHVGEIEDLPDGRIRFEVVTRERPTRKSVWVEAEPHRESLVKPSSGEVQQRIVCRTRIRLGPIEREIDVSLVCRKGMLCRMLIGRMALQGVAVDPNSTYLLTKKPNRSTKETS
ncbi:MAG: ATP-dependent zinc protease [Phycisphaerales bacterium]|nr:ATP-dependent zinc protease [Phycisphaerales bacterium]